jgi:hypothetical protein
MSLVVEWTIVQMLQWWAYAPEMPVLPLIGVGAAPFAQMVVLPSLIFFILKSWHVRGLANPS